MKNSPFVRLDVPAEGLIPNRQYRLLPPLHRDSLYLPWVSDKRKKELAEIYQTLAKKPHIFLGHQGEQTLHFGSVSGNYSGDIYIDWDDLPYGQGHPFREKFLASTAVKRAITHKAKNLELRREFHKRGISGEPGHGPANTIRKMAGIPQPRARRERAGLDWRKNNKGHWTTSRANSPPPTENKAAGKKRKTPNSPNPNRTTRKRIVFSGNQE
jgi:hypothetical protein